MEYIEYISFLGVFIQKWEYPQLKVTKYDLLCRESVVNLQIGPNITSASIILHLEVYLLTNVIRDNC